MPIQFSIDCDSRLVSCQILGTPTAGELQEFLDAVLADPNFRRGFGFVGDRRGASSVAPASYTTALTELVRARAAHLGHCRWAIVVPSENDFGMVRMWGLLTESAGMRVAPFTDPDRARDWASQRSVARPW